MMPRKVNAAKRLENLNKLEATGAVDVFGVRRPRL